MDIFLKCLVFVAISGVAWIIYTAFFAKSRKQQINELSKKIAQLTLEQTSLEPYLHEIEEKIEEATSKKDTEMLSRWLAEKSRNGGRKREISRLQSKLDRLTEDI